MKRNGVFTLLFILGLSLGACSQAESSFDSGSSESEASLDSTSSLEESISAEPSSSSFSYSFEEKEAGLTLEEITAEINKIDPKPEERKKVRYTWHIEEILTGLYPKAMLDSTQMPEGKIVGEFISEPRNHNLDTNIQAISGTPVTQM